MSSFSPTFFVSSNSPGAPDVVNLGTGAGTAYQVTNLGKYPVYVKANGGPAALILAQSEGTVAAQGNVEVTTLSFYVASSRVRYQSLSAGASPAGKVTCKIELTRQAANWTPAELGESLVLWLDASDASSVILNGSKVVQWSDKSGQGNNAVQAAASLQPTYSLEGLNGKNIITFDGVSDGFQLDSPVALPRDMVSVSQGRGYLYAADNPVDRLLYLVDGTTIFWNDQGPQGRTIAGRNATDTFIEHYSLDSSGAVEIFIDGTSKFTKANATWANGNAFNRIGLKYTGTTGQPTWDGTMAEIVGTNEVLSSTKRQKLEGYLAHRWGLAANLPSSHPYKDAPPTA